MPDGKSSSPGIFNHGRTRSAFSRKPALLTYVKSDLELPSISAIRSAVQNVPGINLLLFRPELQQILRNLMVLDWVLRTNVVQSLSSEPG